MIVVGAGRVGTALAARGGGAIALIDRQGDWQLLKGAPGTPILLAVRNDDLPVVLERVPADRRADLVFVQNGMLRPWLSQAGFDEAHPITRGLLFFAVPRRGADLEPGGDSPFHGPRAAAVVDVLAAIDVPASEVDAGQFAAVELEKLIWNSAFGLCCEAFSCDVGTVVREHADTLRELVAELSAVGASALAVTLALEPLMQRLCAYSLSIADYRGAVKEWPWRNGWFVAEARARSLPTPIHDALLARTGH